MHPTRSGGDHDRIVESGDVSPPVWSSDGNDLAFWSDKDGSGIYLLSVDDGQLTKLASLPGPSPDPATVRLSWAPDGRTIAIAAGGRIFEVYADGSGMSPSGNQSDVQTVAYRPQATPSAHQPG
jgi:Tol biopolymer transport system component